MVPFDRMIIAHVASSVARDSSLQFVVMYIGPDLIMPLTSALAAAAGVMLMFWQRVVGAVHRLWHAFFQRKDQAT